MDIQQLKFLNVLVIGDSCEDVYYFGKVERISPEAPVPIFNIINRESLPGMGANVRNNLNTLGIKNTFLTNEEHIIKERYIDIRTKHHLLRVDHGDNIPISPLNIDKLLNHNLDVYDGILIVDYDKGLITKSNMDFILSNFNKPIFVDSKKIDLSIFENCIIKINETENLKVEKYPSTCELIVTLGGKGAVWKNEIFPAKQVEVFDICGAGDTFFSAMSAAILLGEEFPFAINFANKCASISVQKLGTYAPTMEDLNNL